MNELTDEEIRDTLLGNDTGIYNAVRAVIAADRELQAERHAEELLAYEMTVGNLRAQRVPDAALEQVLESTQMIRDFGVAIEQDGYKLAGANLVREALAIERAVLSAAPAPMSEAEIQDMRDRAVGMLDKAFPATQPERKPMTDAELSAGICPHCGRAP